MVHVLCRRDDVENFVAFNNDNKTIKHDTLVRPARLETFYIIKRRTLYSDNILLDISISVRYLVIKIKK